MVNGNNGKPLLVLVPGVGFVGFSLLSLGFDPRADVAKELRSRPRQQCLHLKLLISNQRFGQGSFLKIIEDFPFFLLLFFCLFSPQGQSQLRICIALVGGLGHLKPPKKILSN